MSISIGHPGQYIGNWGVLGTLVFGLALTGCGGGGGDSGLDEEQISDLTPPTAATSGTTSSAGGTLSDVGVKSYLVTAPATDGEQSSASSDASGEYSISVLKDTDTYLEFSKTDYVTLNTTFYAIPEDTPGMNISLLALTEFESIINTAFAGLMLSPADKAWIAVNVASDNGVEADGVAITTTPSAAGGGALYCDGTLTGGDFTSAIPACTPGQRGMMYLAYFDTDTKVLVSAGDGAETSVAPVRSGELTTVSIPWTDANVTTAALRVETEAGGTVQISPAFFQCTGPDLCEAQIPVGTEVTLTAIPDQGYQLDDWDGCDREISDASGEKCIRTISEFDANFIHAEFDRVGVPVDTATLSVEVAAGGTVTTVPDVLTCFGPKTCEAQVAVGTIVTLAATPTAGYTFNDWEGCYQEIPVLNGVTCLTIIKSDPNLIQVEFDPN